MLRIKKGESAIVTRFLKKKDNSNFNRSEFATLTIDIQQKGRTIESLTFPDAYLRAGVADNEVEIEIKKATSDKFSGGPVVAKYTFTVPDVEFADGGTYREIITEEILHVEQLP